MGVLNKSVSSDLTDFPPKAGDSSLKTQQDSALILYTHFLQKEVEKYTKNVWHLQVHLYMY